MFGFGFGFIFSFVPILMFVFFVFFIGTLIRNATRSGARWNANNQAPVLTVVARVVAKRTEIDRHHHMHGDQTALNYTSSATTYFATFEVESGDRMEYRVSGAEFGMLVEGDTGRLTFQGTRFKSFERTRLQ